MEPEKQEPMATEIPHATVRAPGPWVTHTLVIINVAVFAITVALGADLINPDPDRLVTLGGSLRPLTLSGEPWRLLTSMFLHAGALHIALNMLALYGSGRAVEQAFGDWSYLAIYMCAGLVGGIATMTKASMIVVVGASGAVFGVFGAYLAYLVAHRAQLDSELRDRQLKSMGTFVALNLFIGLSVKEISLAAHIGGFVTGFVMGYIAERGIDITDQNLAKRRRGRRVVIGSVLSLAVVGAGLIFLPKSAVGYMTAAEGKQVAALQTKLEKFATTEKDLLAQQNDAAQRAVKGEITYEEQARIFRDDLVPSWRWVRSELSSVTDLPPAVAARQKALVDYIDARIAHIEATVALLALDDKDPAAAAALQNMTAKEAAVAAALENVKEIYANP